MLAVKADFDGLTIPADENIDETSDEQIYEELEDETIEEREAPQVLIISNSGMGNVVTLISIV